MNSRNERWDCRYEKGEHTSEKPSDILKKWVPKIKKGKALDIASGAGRNSLYLSKKGFDVDAIDFSEKALEIATKRSRNKGLDVNWIQFDFDELNLPFKYYDLVTSTNFYLNNQFDKITKTLKEDGWFIYRHHLDIKNSEFERGPPKEYRYKSKEVKEALRYLEIHHYKEYKSSNQSSPMFEIVAKK